MRLSKVKLLFAVVLTATILSCEKNEESDLFYDGPNYISFIEEGSSFTAFQGESNQFGIEIGVTTSSTSDRTFNISIDTEASTGIEGEHFNLDAQSITVKAGEYRGSITLVPIFDDLPTLGIDVVFTLISEDVADFSVTEHSVQVSKYCESDLTGTYTAVSSGSIGENYPYQVTITEGETNGVYTFSDITGGLYTDGYGASDQPAEVVDNCGVLVLDNQPDTVYGGDFFDGAGTVNDNGTLTLTWSNGYGDFGTSVYTKN